MKSCVVRAIAVAMPLLLAACATAPIPVADTARQSAAARPFHQTIGMTGRLSVRYQVHGKEEALHGGFTWSQSPDRTTVTLLSPLGQTMAVINVDPEGATLRQVGHPVHSAPDVDALTAETLGWPLPVAGLREWLQGFATDKSGRRFIAMPFAAEVVSNDGWHIHYPAWHEDNSPPSQTRPRRIDLARTTAQAGDVSLRIVIDSWQPH